MTKLILKPWTNDVRKVPRGYSDRFIGVAPIAKTE
jgi:hypothetical protein